MVEMTNIRYIAGAAVISLVSFLPVSVTEAGDWPQWGGANQRNMVSAEKGLPDAFEPGGQGIDKLNIKWVSKLGSQTFGNPTVSSGKIFVGTNSKYENPKYSGKRGYLLCLDETTGKESFYIFASPERIPDFEGEKGVNLTRNDMDLLGKKMGAAGVRRKLDTSAVAPPAKSDVVEVKKKLQAEGAFVYETWFWHK